MMKWTYIRICSVVVVAFALLLSGLVDPVLAKKRQGHHRRSHAGFGRHSRHHYHYHRYYWHDPFWRFHYYGYPFWLYYEYPFWPYYEGPYGYPMRYRFLNFRLPGFFHYPGAIGKGEITPQNPEGKADEPVSRETQQK